MRDVGMEESDQVVKSSIPGDAVKQADVGSSNATNMAEKVTQATSTMPSCDGVKANDAAKKPVSFASIFHGNKKTVKTSELHNEEVVEGAALAIPFAAVEELLASNTVSPNSAADVDLEALTGPDGYILGGKGVGLGQRKSSVSVSRFQKQSVQKLTNTSTDGYFDPFYL
nr:hypothetical protein [Tanacetum cinerariifolium]